MFGFLFGRSTVYPEPVRTADEFRGKVLQSELPVIVNVWSETCAPCKRLKPVLVEVATAHAAKVRVVEISTNAEPALLAALRVQATPTILVFDGGEEVGRMTGFRPKGWFDDMIAAEL
jgi:thioredoxin 1